MRYLRVAGLLALVAVLGGCGRPGPGFTRDLLPELKKLYDAATATGGAAAWVAVGRAEGALRNWPKAEEAFTKAREKSPDDPGALTGLASLKLALGRGAEAVALIQELDEKHRENAEVQSAVGDLSLAMGSPQMALASYDRALSLDPYEPNALLKRAMAHAQAGDLPRARQLLGRFKSRYPGRPEAAQLELEIAAAARDMATVERLLRQAYDQDPSAARRDALASFYRNEGRHQKSADLINAWVNRNPLAPKPPEDPVEREKWIRLRDEAYLVPRMQLAGIIREQGRTDESRRMMKDLLDKVESYEADGEPPAPKLTEARLRIVYAQSLYGDRQNDIALTELKKAKELSGNDSQMLLQIANTVAEFVKAGSETTDTDFALQTYQEVIDSDASIRQEALRFMTIFLQQLADGEKPNPEIIDNVEQRYLVLLQENSTDVIVLNNLAWHLAKFRVGDKKKMDLALSCIQNAIQLNGRHPNLLDTMGYVLMQAGDLDAAEVQFKAALADDADNPEFNYNLAQLYNKKGNVPAARRHAQRALAHEGYFNGREECERLARSWDEQ